MARVCSPRAIVAIAAGLVMVSALAACATRPVPEVEDDAAGRQRR